MVIRSDQPKIVSILVKPLVASFANPSDPIVLPPKHRKDHQSVSWEAKTTTAMTRFWCSCRVKWLLWSTCSQLCSQVSHLDYRIAKYSGTCWDVKGFLGQRGIWQPRKGTMEHHGILPKAMAIWYTKKDQQWQIRSFVRTNLTSLENWWTTRWSGEQSTNRVGVYIPISFCRLKTPIVRCLH